MKRTALPFASVACLTIVLPASAQLSFSPSIATPLRGQNVAQLSNNWFVAADLNGDGSTDILLPSIDLHIALGDGHGRFDYSAALRPASFPTSCGLSVADIDFDGDLDIVAAIPGAGIRITRNNGVGAFGVPSTFASVRNPSICAVADMDGDGDLDIVSGNTNGNGLSVWRNDAGGFSIVQNVDRPTAIGTGIVLADMDGDGDRDVIVSNTNSNVEDVTVYVNLGSCTIDGGRPFDSAPNSNGVCVADVDGDAWQDVVLIGDESPPGSGSSELGTFSVLRNLGTTLSGEWMGLGAAAVVTVGTEAWAHRVADFNRDGRPDVAVMARSNGVWGVSVHRNAGDGTYPFLPLFLPVTGTPYAIEVFDANGDDLTDIVVYVSEPPAYVARVFFNTAFTQLPPAPFDGVAPIAGATGTSIAPRLTWQSSGSADSYEVTLATDAALTQVVATANLRTPLWIPAAIPLLSGHHYFWSVTAQNEAGSTTISASPLDFTTACQSDFNHSGVTSVQDIFDYLAAYFAGCP